MPFILAYGGTWQKRVGFDTAVAAASERYAMRKIGSPLCGAIAAALIGITARENAETAIHGAA